MESGFGSWMNEEEKEKKKSADDLMELDELNYHLDIADISRAAETNAVDEDSEELEPEKELVPEDLAEFVDQKDSEILSDKRLSAVYRDDPEFGRFVYDCIHEDMKEADRELAQKLKELKKK